MKISEGIFYQDVLRSLTSQRNVKTYLEIGVQAALNLSQIEVEEAIGIDPDFKIAHDPTFGKKAMSLYRMSSDEYFSSHNLSNVDFAFLDGMHKIEFLVRDFYNVESSCNPNALIAIHDCLPFGEDMISRQDTFGPWTGDVWKIVLILEKFRPDLRVVLLDAAPTGLVCVTNVDSQSTLLKDRYFDVLDFAFSISNDRTSLNEFYSNHSIVSAASVINDLEQSRYFRI